MITNNIFICASDLAVVTGHSPFKDKEEIILKYWKRHFNQDYLKTKEIMKKKKITQKIEETHMQCIERISKENSINIKALKNDLYKCVNSKNTETLQKDKNALIENALKNVPEAQRQELKESLTHVTNTSFGIKNENDGVAVYMSKTGNSVEKTSKYFKEELFIIDNELTNTMDIWTIGGKVDGIATDKKKKKIILEIKNRVKELFNTVRNYEKVQCYAYMYVLGIHRIHLAEILKSRVNNDMNIDEIIFDEEFWQTKIFDRISQFVDEFYEFLNNPKLKIDILRSYNHKT